MSTSVVLVSGEVAQFEVDDQILFDLIDAEDAENELFQTSCFFDEELLNKDLEERNRRRLKDDKFSDSISLTELQYSPGNILVDSNLDEKSKALEFENLQRAQEEVQDLLGLLEIIDDPSEIAELTSRIRKKKLQMTFRFSKEKDLRDDLMKMIVRLEELQTNPVTVQNSEVDSLMDRIWEHEDFLDQYCPLELKRSDGMRNESPLCDSWFDSDFGACTRTKRAESSS